MPEIRAMAVSLRLEKQLEQELERTAEEEGLTKSQMLRQCLIEYLQRKKSSHLAWELGKDLFGKVGSSRGDLAAKHKRIFREKLHARKSRR
jgi:RHH-type transcriptional regulator, rel operon repressor / antitoxin RelB